MVRALTRPYPGAFTYLGGKKLFIWKGHVGAEKAEGQPGQVLELTPEGAPVVTGDGVYFVQNAGWEGGPVLPAREILREGGLSLASRAQS